MLLMQSPYHYHLQHCKNGRQHPSILLPKACVRIYYQNFQMVLLSLLHPNLSNLLNAKVICTRKPVQNILSEEILKFGDAKLVVVLIFLAMQWPTLKLEKKPAIGNAVVLGGHTAINCLMDL